MGQKGETSHREQKLFPTTSRKELRDRLGTRNGTTPGKKTDYEVKFAEDPAQRTKISKEKPKKYQGGPALPYGAEKNANTLQHA